ncbi:MAG: DUF975 family protein [Clostridia bacterium]|nr:DUF975 family protein [Clostridia bacterium]
MVTYKELRTRAWNSLSSNGKYLNALVAMLIVSAISGVIGFVSVLEEPIILLSSQLTEKATVFALIFAVFALVLSVIVLVFCFFVLYPLNIGTARFFIRNTYEKPDVAELFFGFKNNYSGNVKTMFLVFLKTLLWTLLFIIPGIIKSYEYAIIPYILAENPEISSKEAFRRAKELMTGRKADLFLFSLSYIGWELLGIMVCCGIGSFFVTPYINAGLAEFYREISTPHFD